MIPQAVMETEDWSTGGYRNRRPQNRRIWEKKTKAQAGIETEDNNTGGHGNRRL